MQRDDSSSTRGLINSTTDSSPFRSQNDRYYSSSIQNTSSDGSGFTSLESSIFPPKSSLCNSVYRTPSPSSSNDENNPIATENRLYLARLTLQYQDLMDRYGLCLGYLENATQQADALSQENATLRLVNKDLTKRLSLLAETSLHQNHRYISSGFPSLSIINDFRSLCIADNNGGGTKINRVAPSHEVPVTSPTSVIGNNNRFQEKGPQRVSLPKSISIRSSAYLKMNQAGINAAAAAHRTNRLRVATSPLVNTAQRVYVPAAGENKDQEDQEALELDVYNQGMFKTELCNKWQETGACPYGDQCQFAHGIGELRPVIRHPRYKTEVCRMVLSGGNCPYGHRCHFRHALTEQERLTGTTTA